jgi:hypothetical protein
VTDRIFIQAPDGSFWSHQDWLRVTQHNKKQFARPPTPDLPSCKSPPSMRRGGEAARSFVRADWRAADGPICSSCDLHPLVNKLTIDLHQPTLCRWREQPSSELSDNRVLYVPYLLRSVPSDSRPVVLISPWHSRWLPLPFLSFDAQCGAVVEWAVGPSSRTACNCLFFLSRARAVPSSQGPLHSSTAHQPPA